MAWSLEKRGVPVTSFGLKLLTSVHFPVLHQRLCRREFGRVWISFIGNHAPSHTRERIQAQACQLGITCWRTGIPYASMDYAGRLQINHVLLTPEVNMTVFSLALCRLKVSATPYTNLPAYTAFEVITSLPFSSDLPCTCPEGTVHQDGWTFYRRQEREERQYGGSAFSSSQTLSRARKAEAMQNINDVLIDRLRLAARDKVSDSPATLPAALHLGEVAASSSSTPRSQTACQPDNPDSNRKDKRRVEGIRLDNRSDRRDEDRAFTTTTETDDDQDADRRHDYWTKGTDDQGRPTIIRRHVQERRRVFAPDSSDCPVNIAYLASSSLSLVHPRGGAPAYTKTHNWRLGAEQLPHHWKGTTTFRVLTAPEAAYPTEEAERAKARKKAGHTPVPRKKVVQDHYDDIGDNLSGLGPDEGLKDMFKDVKVDAPEELDTNEHLAESFVAGFQFGTQGSAPASTSWTRPNTYKAASLQEALSMLATWGAGRDMCELCGGEARATQVAIRRQLHTGENFDLVTNCDLGDPLEQKRVLIYVEQHDVIVVVMAPSCRTTGPPSGLNYQINYDTWVAHYNEDAPHIEFCGKVALLQMQRGRYFFVEQPHPTWLRTVPPWDQLAAHPQVGAETFDQCRMGVKGPRGLLVKKPSIAIANSPHLPAPFRDLRCRGDHDHYVNWGNSPYLRTLQVWPWGLAERLVQGIATLVAAVRSAALLAETLSYPATGSRTGPEALQELERQEAAQTPAAKILPAPQRPRAAPRRARAPQETAGTQTGPDDQPPSGPDARKLAQRYSECPGCRSNRSHLDPRHLRVPGKCAIPPGVESPYTCPGCARDPPRERQHPDHNRKPG